ncbi:periplasmic monoheme cytochrome c553 [Campylobacter pinnipediorum subsp. pinnipediorum]|uniref:Cytochrome C n=1 Tax=Campylobacter pinnipediorum subsp. pinnipediorum TaxID=1660067 RepID=A0AAX0LAN4_9BACT|nr:c-type cytochrome [Campylobacter pinnipediorum]AQW81165.1 periplasmic monoheme cytochrome c553 [Campylobacter pinnipediorum subsp. pinnipediorum]OPA77952.1 cytochrome C [Campylobacter pinnipediorum subsp. pinnipediorum]
MKKLLIISGAIAMFATCSFAADGSTLYKKCIACHGAKAEKKFNNKVGPLNTLSKEDIVSSLKGYKDGSINKYAMGAMMKPVAKPLSDDDMNAVADYIQTLK